MTSVLAAAAVAAAIGCRRQGEQPLTGQTHAYLCGDGYRFVVRFEPQRAWIFEGDTVSSAPQVPSRDGVHYAARSLVFTMDNDVATLKRGATERSGCVRQQ